MSASEHLSPTQLHEHVQEHLKSWEEKYDTPTCADGNCWHASRGYITKALESGHDAVFQTHDVPDDLQVPHHTTHTVAQVQTSHGPYVVDLTHRQFDAKAPYPLVESLDKFMGRETMKPFKYISEYDIDEID